MTHGKEAMVAKNHGFALTEGVRNALALLRVQYDSGVVVEQRMVVVEGTCILGQRSKKLGQTGKRLAVQRVRMRGAHHIGPRCMDLRMNGKSGLVKGLVPFDDLAVMTHQHEVTHPNMAEMHAEGIDPKVVSQLGVTGRDVSGHSLIEPELGEQPEPCSEHLLAVQTFVGQRTFLRPQDIGNGAGSKIGGVVWCAHRVPSKRWKIGAQRYRQIWAVSQADRTASLRAGHAASAHESNSRSVRQTIPKGPPAASGSIQKNVPVPPK